MGGKLLSLNYISRDELQTILAQLDQALYNHIQRHNSLIRTLTCKLPSDKHNTVPKAYKECLFGQWYYNDAPQKLREHQGFAAIGEAHKHMHQLCAGLLLTTDAGNVVILQETKYSLSLHVTSLQIYAPMTNSFAMAGKNFYFVFNILILKAATSV